MLKKTLYCLAMLVVVFGCAQQQKDSPDNTTEETHQVEANVAIAEISLEVTGMTCGVCAGKVKDALTKVEGVTEIVSVSHTDKKAVVKVKKDIVKPSALVEAIAAIKELADNQPVYTAQVIE